MDFNITKQSSTNKVRLGDLVNKRIVNNTNSSNSVPLADINLIANPKKMSRSEDGGSVKSFNSADEKSVMDAANLGSRSFNPSEFTRRHTVSIASNDSTNDSGSDDSDNVSMESGNVSDVDSDDGSVNIGSVASSSDESINGSVVESVAVSEAPKSYDQILKEKQELLFKIERLGRYGIHPTKRLTMASSLEEIQHEYKKLRRGRDLDASIKFQRKVLIAVTGGIEFLNNRFDPIDAKLDGWSESLMENITDYDEVFEELAEKYGGASGDVPPEIKLLMMIGGSAFMFHLTNTMFKSSIPGMDDIMKQNPDLMKQFAKAAVSSIGKTNDEPPPTRQQRPVSHDINMGGRPDMNGPSGIDDIINNMNLQPSDIPDLDTISIVSGDTDKLSQGSKGITLNL